MDTHIQSKQPYFNKKSDTVDKVINRIWFSHYPRSQYIVYDNGSKFKLHFKTFRDSFSLKRKQTRVRNLQLNAILKQMDQTIMVMLHPAELDMLTQSVRVI